MLLLREFREPEFCICSKTHSCETCMEEAIKFFTTEELVKELLERNKTENALTCIPTKDLEWELKCRGGI